MLFVINYDSEIRPPSPSMHFSPHSPPAMSCLHLFMSHSAAASHHLPLSPLSPPNPLFFFFLTEVEAKSLKQCIGWARREQTQPRICLSCSGGGWGVGFLIKCFWILIWKGDGGSNKVKNERKKKKEGTQAGWLVQERSLQKTKNSLIDSKNAES